MTDAILWAASLVYFLAHMLDSNTRWSTALSGILFLTTSGQILPAHHPMFHDASVLLVAAILIRRSWIVHKEGRSDAHESF